MTLCYGTRSADYLAGVDDFRWLGIEVHVSTDDGTAGHHGLVTDVLREVRTLADRTGARVVIHLAQSESEVQAVWQRDYESQAHPNASGRARSGRFRPTAQRIAKCQRYRL